jgi:hypothetical protein
MCSVSIILSSFCTVRRIDVAALQRSEQNTSKHRKTGPINFKLFIEMKYCMMGRAHTWAAKECRRWLWTVLSSWLWRRVVRWKSTDVSWEKSSPFLGLKNEPSKKTACMLPASCYDMCHFQQTTRRYITEDRTLPAPEGLLELGRYCVRSRSHNNSMHFRVICHVSCKINRKISHPAQSV